MVLGSMYKIRIGEHRGVMPDVQLYRAGNEPGLDQRHGLVTGRPDLCVEVLSPSGRRYDCIVKLAYYASIKVPEYWLVDPDARTLERLVLSRKGSVVASIHEGDSKVSVPTFPGLRIPLFDLWLPPAPRRSKAAPKGRKKR